MFQIKRPAARALVRGLAIASAVLIAAASVEAKPGGGKSVGSRGTKTQMAPPETNTAPRQAQPLPGAQQAAPRVATPSAPVAPQAAPSRWNGLLGGFAGGLIGAGLIGMLMGHGFMGGMGSFMSMIGLLLQVALVFFIVRFAINYFRNRNAKPALAVGPETYARQPMQPEWVPPAAPAAAPAAPVMPALAIQQQDFEAFERLLGEIQELYGRGDRIGLAQRTTPEIANVFNADLDELARNGLINKVGGAKLLQGDLAEAWREPDAEFATVAMRYSVFDAKMERSTGRIVEGSLEKPQESTEIWTFVRASGAGPQDWKLSAIQQA